MLDALEKIDISPIKQLLEIKKQQDVLAERLSKMQATKDKVSEAVYQRVHDDYTRRNGELEEQARPLKADAKRQYTGLKRCHDEITAQLEAARLDKEEVEFRHELGEFEEAEFKKRLDECKKTIGGHEKDLKDAEGLRKQFLAAFNSEQELEDSHAETAPASKPAESQSRAPEPEPEDDTATRFVDMGATDMAGKAPAEGNQTMVLRRAVLIDSRGDERKSFPVSFLGSVLGSAESAQIRLLSKKVDGEHAEVRMVEDGGYVVRRLSRSAAISVNGESVDDECEIAHGDRLQLGDIELTFDNGQ